MPDQRDAQARRHRRAILRAHHPDLGGDPAELVRQLQLLERAERDTGWRDTGERDMGEVVFVTRPRGLRALLARLRRRRRPPRVR